MNEALDPTALRDSVDAAFSYVCHRCLNCCRDKLIQVNPYEAARLARNRGMSTTDFIAGHLDGVYLRRVANGACEFLGPEGCRVHSDRPLVCRLYPLGRHVAASGEITYSHHAPHTETKGIYGREGTVADFLANQGVAPFAAAADRYLSALQTLFDAWKQTSAKLEPAAPQSEHGELNADHLFDLDLALAAHCAANGIEPPTDIDARMTLHLEIIAGLAGPPTAKE